MCSIATVRVNNKEKIQEEMKHLESGFTVGSFCRDKIFRTQQILEKRKVRVHNLIAVWPLKAAIQDPRKQSSLQTDKRS